jgi:hypothetical protein
VEKRKAPRRRVLKTGYIVFSDKAPKLECVVKSVSKTGALLQVSTTIGIPVNIDVVIDGVRRHCGVIRKTDTRLAVAFK